MKKKLRLWIVLSLLAMSLLFCGCSWSEKEPASESGRPQYSQDTGEYGLGVWELDD